ncbi:MAG: methyl-coenzyme M reductase subunit beta [Halobacteriota archaeon]|nr:methyl-coenzyme M reductase subunit beta [Halobacteriota archaeon]
MVNNSSNNISLYDDRGDLLAENVPLSSLSPYKNEAMKNILFRFKRTGIVNLYKLENSLKTGEVGGLIGVGSECMVPGRELDLPIMERKEEIVKEVKKMIEVVPGDDTQVDLLDKLLVIQLPSACVNLATDYSQVYLISATAVAHALVKIFNLGVFDGVDMIKSALLGRYPQTTSPTGCVSALLSFPTTLEGTGNAYRSVSVNDIAALTNKRTFYAAALGSVLEHAAAFECGDALGPYRRYHLLGLGYQGLNGNNLVYEFIRDAKKGGKIVDVIDEVLKRALDDKVIYVKKTLPSGFDMYAANDVSFWNAYAAAGQMAAAIINAGISRGVQGTPSAMLFYNDLIVLRTGLPSVDFGRAHGTSNNTEWLTHSIYGGGGPGLFKGEYLALKGSKGFVFPCICAAMCLDAGTQIFSPEMTSENRFGLREIMPELKNPLQDIAEAAKN